MTVLESSQVVWLLRELELAGLVAMRRAAPYLSQKLWLIQQLPTARVSTDAAFQLRLARHLGLRGKLRQCEPALFELIDRFRQQPPQAFETVLQAVSALTGQVEKSVASEILALFSPDAPVIDRELRELLPRYGFATLAEAPSLQQCLQWHESLCGLFDQILASPAWPRVRARLQQHLDAPVRGQISDARMLNAALTHARRTIALIPVPRMPAQASASGSASGGSSAPSTAAGTEAAGKVSPSAREGRLLHVCR
ncbi:MAG: hypothetical protein ACK5SV_04165 [Burkholderiales bacterium]